MSFLRKSMLVFLIFGVFVASCGGQAATEPAPDINAILTAGVGTLAASIFETQTAMVPPATHTPASTASPSGTPFSLATSTSSPTQGFFFNPVVVIASLSPTPIGTQYTPTVNPSTLAFGCNNLLLISDVTIPAGTVLKPGESFTKTWKVQNNGTCNWVFQYRLAFVSGERMEGEPAGLGKVIEPQKWTQVSINLIAPTKAGTVVGNWRMSGQTGRAFGSTLTVSIVVAPPANNPLPPTDTPIPSP